MEFILFMQVCAVFLGECGQEFINPKPYPTFRECVVDGYTRSLKFYEDMDISEVNENGLAIRISCRELSTTKS